MSAPRSAGTRARAREAGRAGRIAPVARRTRIGIFGGTFDPPHAGHLVVAEWARELLDLDRVVFVPSGTPPHKLGRVRSAAAVRLAMTRLAVRGNASFEVSSLETRRDGPSFTIDTVRALRRRHPESRLFLIIGADSLAEFHTWREPDAIAAEVTLAVAERSGTTGGRGTRRGAGRTPRRFARSAVWLGNPALDVSSSTLRARAAAGRSLRYLVPDPVARYIARHGLYRSGS